MWRSTGKVVLFKTFDVKITMRHIYCETNANEVNAIANKSYHSKNREILLLRRLPRSSSAELLFN